MPAVRKGLVPSSQFPGAIMVRELSMSARSTICV
jgi:hypothetical protein